MYTYMFENIFTLSIKRKTHPVHHHISRRTELEESKEKGTFKKKEHMVWQLVELCSQRALHVNTKDVNNREYNEIIY